MLGEISFFEIEHVGYHSETKERKLFDKKYYLIQLIDFITVIDTMQDQEILKIKKKVGSGIRRIGESDLIKISFNLSSYLHKTIWEMKTEEFIKIEDVKNILNSNLKKLIDENFFDNILSLLTSMKPNEISCFEINNPQFSGEEHEVFDLIDKVPYRFSSKKVFLEIEILDLSFKEDLYEDGTVVKTVHKIGYSTARPDKLTTIYFDYELVHKNEIIYSTFNSPDCIYNRKNKKVDSTIKLTAPYYEQKKILKAKLSNFYWSKLFEDLLFTMKKFEYSEVQVVPDHQFLIFESETTKACLDNVFNWGKDYNKVKKYLEELYNKDFHSIVQECNFFVIIRH